MPVLGCAEKAPLWQNWNISCLHSDTTKIRSVLPSRSKASPLWDWRRPLARDCMMCWCWIIWHIITEMFTFKSGSGRPKSTIPWESSFSQICDEKHKSVTNRGICEDINWMTGCHDTAWSAIFTVLWLVVMLLEELSYLSRVLACRWIVGWKIVRVSEKLVQPTMLHHQYI